MGVFTKTTGLHGSTLYRKDGRMMKTVNVPTAVIALLEHQDSVDEDNMVKVAPPKICVFCGEKSSRTKFVNLQTVALCDEHYFNKTTGEVVAKLRGDSDEEVTE